MSVDERIEKIVRGSVNQTTGNIDATNIEPMIEALSAVVRQAHAEAIVSDEQIKHMASRFLQWRLPENFNPDGGISFKKTYNEHASWGPMKHEPVGTNLLDATQAEEMVRYITAELLPVNPSVARIEAELRTAEARKNEFRDTVVMCTTFTVEQMKTLIKGRAKELSDKIATLRRERDAEIERLK